MRKRQITSQTSSPVLRCQRTSAGAISASAALRFDSSGTNSIRGVAESGFALTVESFCFGKRTKPSALTSGPTSSGSFAPVPWCGYAPTRHPWRNGARPASMPVAPHHDTCAQPSDARLAVSEPSRYEKQSKSKSALRLFQAVFFACPTANLGQVNVRRTHGRHNCDLWTAERRCCAVGDSARMPS